MLEERIVQDSTTDRAVAPPRDFSCSWTDSGLGAAWMRLAGELDIAAAAELERTLREPGLQARLVVLDLRELSFMDCAGLHAIVDASVRARKVARRFVVLRGPANVDRLFRLTGSFDHVEIVDLEPAEPPVQVLLQLAAEAQAA